MELFHLIQFLLAIDERWLRPLQTCVPDLQQVLDDPAEAFRHREIEIGPWNRYVLRYVIPLVLMIPALVVMVVADSLAGTIGSMLVWLLLACALVRAGRGGSCFLGANGVEFRYRGVTVFCPWDLFRALGTPIYYPAKHRLDLPVERTAIARIEVRRDSSVVAQGYEARASHFQILPSGEIRLKIVYAANPQELGNFLLDLGRKLGVPGDRDLGEPTPAPSSCQAEKGGWIRVVLTRLVFPPFCCDCCQVADQWQEFRGYPSMFATDLSVGESFLNIQAPICVACKRSNRRQYWRTLFKTTILAMIGITFLSFLLGLILDLCGIGPGQGAMTAILSFVGFIVGLGLSWIFADKYARTVSSPLSLSDYRPGNGTIQVRFRNSRYSEVFLAAMETNQLPD